jgi:LDH2 family malate/lactate/ureidoglycolate dehydrogenase
MLAPLGGADFGYKGAALAGLAEVLGGMLTGMMLGTEQSGVNMGDRKVGHFVMAIDPSTFIGMEVFTERLAKYIDSFAAQPGTMPAGGPQWIERRDRETNGIPLPDGLHGELTATAKSWGVKFPA